MDVVSGLTLGVVQGITEFLPISSSGHLILAREMLGLQTEYGLSVDAVLQLATSLAILVYFRREFARLFAALFNLILGKPMERSDAVVLFALVLGTIPAVVLGIFLENYMETTFRNAELVAWTLIAGALIFLLAEKFAKQNEFMAPEKGLWIGFFQALALIPGMSRSGMAISGGLFFGLAREEAARFAFLLGFPIIFGSGLKKFLELGSNGVLSDLGVSLFFSALAAFAVGMLAIHYLLGYLRGHTLAIFIWYRLALAAVVLSGIYIF